MSSNTPFSDWELSPALLLNLKNCGYETATSIQTASIPVLLEGRDLLATAQTGTGKTGAFAIPMLARLDASWKKPQVLVLTPTRELAQQVAKSFEQYGKNVDGYKGCVVYGGANIQKQIQELNHYPSVIVGTPGRVLDLYKRKKLFLDELKALVLDEADEMLKMGFLEDVETILDAAPDDIQHVLFSATLPPAVKKIVATTFDSPEEIHIAAQNSVVSTIEQIQVDAPAVKKPEILARIIEMEEPASGIIFVRTKVNTVKVSEQLGKFGIRSLPINGDLNQNQREWTLDQLRSSRVHWVVATDVAARGIDIDHLNLVINYELPLESEAYVHRIGRTGRAGRKGKAISLVAPGERRLLKQIERLTGSPLKTAQIPNQEQIAEKRQNVLLNKIEANATEENHQLFSGLLNEWCAESGLHLENFASAMLSLLQENKELFPELPDLNVKEERKERRERGERGDRSERGSRGERSERPRRTSKDRRGQKDDFELLDDNGKPVKMDTFSIQLGKKHRILPKDIVGAFVNEGQLEKNIIGNIKLFQDYTLIDLPAGMPKEVFKKVARIQLKGKKINFEKRGAPRKRKG